MRGLTAATRAGYRLAADADGDAAPGAVPAPMLGLVLVPPPGEAGLDDDEPRSHAASDRAVSKAATEHAVRDNTRRGVMGIPLRHE